VGLAFFKATRTPADYGRMPQAPKLLAALVLAALVVALLAGCGSSSEPTAAVAIVKSGLLGSFGDELQREDDADEVRELREMEPQTRSEREEAHEQIEEASLAAAQAAEHEGDLEAAQLDTQRAEQAEAGEGGDEAGESAVPAGEDGAPSGEGAEATASAGEGETS
jgi:hypothetical protein